MTYYIEEEYHDMVLSYVRKNITIEGKARMDMMRSKEHGQQVTLETGRFISTFQFFPDDNPFKEEPIRGRWVLREIKYGDIHLIRVINKAAGIDPFTEYFIMRHPTYDDGDDAMMLILMVVE
jgi:hypothetical protein